MEYLDYIAGLFGVADVILSWYLIPFVFVPVGVIASILFVCRQKSWWVYLIVAAAGGALNCLAAVGQMGEATFFGPIGSVPVGMAMGVGYLSCVRPPRSRRIGALGGLVIGLLCTWLGYHFSITYRLPSRNGLGEEDTIEMNIAHSYFVVAFYYGLIGALLGSWIGARLSARQRSKVGRSSSAQSSNPEGLFPPLE